jgi:hypothetical protein
MRKQCRSNFKKWQVKVVAILKICIRRTRSPRSKSAKSFSERRKASTAHGIFELLFLMPGQKPNQKQWT